MNDFNMYGCSPCPNCKSEYRCVFSDKPGVMQCDDCGHEEPCTPDNYELYEEHYAEQ